MGRPREFDEEQVVDLARDAFWANGIAATSISDLSEATGLSVGSIYKAFENKAALCHRTLDTYLDEGLAATIDVLESGPTPLDGINAYLDVVATRAGDRSPTRGCYAVGVAMELAATDEPVRRRLRAHDRKLRAAVRRALANAVADGQLDCDPERGARLLTTAVNGVQVEARKGIRRDEARDILDMALSALDRAG
ncbi:MAG: TetR/AcrR family transcriptional regulator [Ilumatobacter sp.]|uniref:TetR/AcrR family transcriptional regulator n=1 Tax=Ilumatobacter sp. TaxID=1967498 RepID=UPI002612B3D9|nr:TetR/AcrR family transcriptional regulator [Ilumatobacter sp.]MDJ0768992.1 TetR/AcrR family transcriptional regulator [Ilumatobacter sp.]